MYIAKIILWPTFNVDESEGPLKPAFLVYFRFPFVSLHISGLHGIVTGLHTIYIFTNMIRVSPKIIDNGTI